jgi:AcrR family transcriptional regulator
VKRAAARRQPAAARRAGAPGVREQAARATREGILKAAIKVFALHGYDGGSVEKISRAARSYDRMIYYYFGSKEGLFIAVIEEAYRRFNEAEAALELDEAKPAQALAAVIRFVWRYYQANPEFITLLNTENLHRGKHISKRPQTKEYSSPAIGASWGAPCFASCRRRVSGRTHRLRATSRSTRPPKPWSGAWRKNSRTRS